MKSIIQKLKLFNQHGLVKLELIASASYFHTSRSYVIPDIAALSDKKSKQDVLCSFRNTVQPVSNDTALAGEPISTETYETMRDEVLQKWNEKPHRDVNKDWIKFSILH